MIRRAMIIVSLSAGLPLAAQSITQAAPGIMRFEDSNGVSFRYPVTWTFTEQTTWQFAMSIQPSAPSQGRIRGRIFTHSLPGVRPWPVTSFSGVEFGYDARPVDSSEDCRALALSGFHAGTKEKIDQVTIRGISYWHGASGDGAMSQFTSDDIYTTFVGAPQVSGSCLLFDLAVHETTAPGRDKPLRPYTPREKSVIHGSLANILDSVRIPASSQ
jgi:hypothetical protein